MKALTKLYSKFKKEKIVFTCAFFGDTFLNLVLIQLLNEIINVAYQLDFHHFGKSALYFFTVLSIFILFIILDQYSFRKLIYYGQTELKKHTYKKFLHNFDKTLGRDLGEFVSAIHSDTSIISQWLSNGHINAVIQSVILMMYLFLMATYNILITLLTLILILTVFILSKYFAEKEATYIAKQQGLYAKINSFLLNNLQNKPLISQLHNESFFERKLKAVHKDGSDTVFTKLSRYVALNDAMLTFMTNTLPLVIFIVSLLLTKFHLLTVGNAVAMMLVAQKLNEPIIVLADLIADKKNAQEVYSRIEGLYAEGIAVYGKDDVESFESMAVDIAEYRYPMKGEPILADTHFRINKGDIVLIKGKSGAGKTTLINLLSRLADYDELDGAVNYNQKNVICYNREKYYKHVMQVEQETVLIDGSILDNILLDDQFPASAVEEVLCACMLTDFIEQKGPDFVIIENGGNISGGERQRIGLARILLRKPDVIILDEVTSALDVQTKKILVSRLIDYIQKYEMTIVAVSHDYSFDSVCSQRIEL